MAIQNRRGQDLWFDPNKMLPGEMAVSTDKKTVYVAFAPGDVREFAFADQIPIVGDVTPDKLQEAVNNYLNENPVQAGATEEEAKQIELNRKNIETLNNQLFNKIYPVGSIYMSANNVEPSLLFGGTWEQIKDTFLLSAGDKYEGGKTGGESEHKLTIEEMPEHNHGLHFATSTGAYASPPLGSGGAQWGSHVNTVSNTGGSKPHNNMPPYLTVYMWKRVE